MRLPFGADKQIGELPLDAGDAAQGFGVAGRELIPDAPDVFPALETHAVEEGVLQIVGVVARPAAADVDHVARLDPFPAAHGGNETIFPVAPAQVVPRDGLVVGAGVFRLQRQRVAVLVRRRAKGAGDKIHGVAVDAVGADLAQVFSSGRGERAGIVRADVPRHDGKQNADAALMEIAYHLLEAGDAAGHIVQQIELIAVVDADVGVHGPDEDGIDAAVAPVEIVKIMVDGVALGDGVEEVAILDHHLRLHEAALRPFEFMAVVFGAVVADARETLGAPLFHFGQPGVEIG